MRETLGPPQYFFACLSFSPIIPGTTGLTLDKTMTIKATTKASEHSTVTRRPGVRVANHRQGKGLASAQRMPAFPVLPALGRGAPTSCLPADAWQAPAQASGAAPPPGPCLSAQHSRPTAVPTHPPTVSLMVSVSRGLRGREAREALTPQSSLFCCEIFIPLLHLAS